MRTRIRYVVNRIDEEYFDGEDAKTEMIRARVEPELKWQAEEVFAGRGLSPTEAITLFYRQVTLHHGLPFAVKAPNGETLAALRQARAGRDSSNTPTWRISKLGTVVAAGESRHWHSNGRIAFRRNASRDLRQQLNISTHTMGARSLGGQDPDTGGDQGCVERTGRRPRGAPSAGHGRDEPAAWAGGCQPSLAVVAATRPRTSPHAGEEGGSGTENGGLESFPIVPLSRRIHPSPRVLKRCSPIIQRI